MTRAVIYTDLDGTLLDHNSYSHAPADAMIAELERRDIPLIPCTSKTRAELLPIRNELHNCHPFIIENGAAVLIPAGYFELESLPPLDPNGFHRVPFVQPHAHWLALLAQAGRPFRDLYRGFSELSLDQIVAATGLDTNGARLAQQREYGEPILWSGNEEQRSQFIQSMTEAGATVLAGGRFLHISGRTDKGLALQWLNNLYATDHQCAPISIAAGDSNNDVAMLEAADFALIIRSPAHPPPDINGSGQVLLSRLQGPAGWAAGIADILQRISSDTKDS